MHYLTFAVIKKDTPEGDIESAVDEVMKTGMNRLWDWFQIGGRWCNHSPDNQMTVGDFLKSREGKPVDEDMPCLYFDYHGESIDMDEHIGIMRVKGWDWKSPEYVECQHYELKQMLKMMTDYCKPDDIIIIVDCHN